MIWTFRSFLAVVALSSSACGLVSAADLSGSTVTLQAFSPTQQTPLTVAASATVGPGIEFPDGSIAKVAPAGSYLTGISVDIGSNYILEQYTQTMYAPGGNYGGAGNFNGTAYQFGPSSPLITAITIDPSSTFRLSYDGLLYTYQNQVFIDRTEFHIQKGDFLKLNLTFADAATTPEPSSATLLLFGVVGALAWNRRKNSKV